MLNLLKKVVLIGIFSICYGKITINGVPKKIEENILHRLEHRIPPQSTIISEHLQDRIIRETKEAIKPFGYFRPQIYISPWNHVDQIVINIKLNQQALIHKTFVKLTEPIAETEALTRLVEQVKKYENTPLTNDALYTMELNLQSIMSEYGYYDAIISRGNTSVNRHSHQAIIEHIITPKNKSTFGQIKFPDQDVLPCFNRYHDIKPGDDYQNEKIHQLKVNMMSSGLFERTSITTQPRENSPHIQDINIDYTPVKPVNYSLRVGVHSHKSEQLVPQAQTQIKFNNIDGCGLSFNNTGYVSSEELTLESRGVFPSKQTIDQFTTISAKYHQEDKSNDNTSDYMQLQLLTHVPSRDLKHFISLNYLYEDSYLLKNNIPYKYETNLLYLKHQMSLARKTGFLNLSFKTSIMGGHSNLGSDIDFARFTGTISARYHTPKIILNHQDSFGQIFTNDFDQFPFSMQFYLGGSSSLRGLPYHDIKHGKQFILSRNNIQSIGPYGVYYGLFFDVGYCSSDNPSVLRQWKPSIGVIGSIALGNVLVEASVGSLIDEDNAKWVFLFNAELDME